MNTNMIWLYACIRNYEGKLIRYTFDPTSCVLNKKGTEDILRDVACITIDDGVLYTSSLDSGRNNLFSSYSIQSDGTLRLINRESAFGFDATHISVNHEKKVFIASDFLANSLLLYNIREDGGIGRCLQIQQFNDTGTNIGPRQDSPHPHGTIVVADGDYMVTADLGCDKLRLFDGNIPSKSLFELNLSPGAGPRHLVAHPTLDYIYVVSEISSEVFSCYLDRNRNFLVLKQILNNLKYSEKDESIGGDIAISPDGKWLTVSNRGENTIVVYQVDHHGLLKFHSTVKTDGWARVLRFDSTSQFLFAALEEFLDVGAYKIPKERCSSVGGIQIFYLDETHQYFKDTGVREKIPQTYAFAIFEGRQ